MANYFEGANSYTGAAAYGKVEYSNVYNNIGLQYYSNAQGRLEYDFVVAGGDLSQIKLSFQGASVSLDASGNLVLSTGQRSIIEEAPTFYQLDGQGNKIAVGGKYQLNPDGSVGFTASGVDPGETLYVDPVVMNLDNFGAEEGGATGESIDPMGNTYLVGFTATTGFPTTTGSVDGAYGGGTEDAFVVKYGGPVSYFTYLGGSGQDVAFGVASDAAGDAYVTGSTSSSNFYTTTGALASHTTTSTDTFVVKLDPTGSAFLYSTVLDGTSSANTYVPSSFINGGGIAIDAYGNAYVTGTTSDPSHFPNVDLGGTTAYGMSAFIVELNSTGTGLLFSTLISGGSSGSTASTGTVGTSIAVDASYNIYATGYTDVTNSGFSVTTGSYDLGGSGEQGYVVEISPTSSTYAWDYRALLGSDLTGHRSHDQANGIAVNSSGNAFVVGNGRDTSGNYTDYVLEMTADGTGLVYDKDLIAWNTSAGTATGISLDAQGDAWVAGYDSSGTLVMDNEVADYQVGTATQDGFVVEVDASTYDVDFATYLGGTDDQATAISINPFGQFAGALIAQTEDFPDLGFVRGGIDPPVALSFDGQVQPLPPTPSVTNISATVGGTVTYYSNGITNEQNLFVYGHAPTGSTVTLYQDGVAIANNISVSSGAWSYDHTAATLTQGGYDFTATDTIAGAPAVAVTMDAEVMSLSPVIHVTATDMVGLASSDPVSVVVDGGAPNEIDYSGTLINGVTNFTLTGLTVGTHTVVAQAADLAHNLGASATITFEVVTSTWAINDATRQLMSSAPTSTRTRSISIPARGRTRA